MIIKNTKLKNKVVGKMVINEYRINPDYSGALIEINGKHGKIRCIGEDRTYFVIEGKGKFIINDKETEVSEKDLIFIPKNTPYDIEGKMKFFLFCSPKFNAKHDVSLE